MATLVARIMFGVCALTANRELAVGRGALELRVCARWQVTMTPGGYLLLGGHYLIPLSGLCGTDNPLRCRSPGE